MIISRLAIVSVLLPTLVGLSAAAGEIDGNWARGDGKAKVVIAPCGEKICATNTWIKPGTPKEKTGDRLIMDIKQSEAGSYSGTAFDPQRDKSYKITVTVAGNNMTTKGCIVAGLLCKGISWTRID
ncbi:Uncharacterized conserved protein, DUF2147 family [Agrobacterium fabrum]|jgi:uncharacterized protein (DUF2147 family)|uniref:DUF2147 domain-containing protein n=1 Tax=Agrobacterium fabrum TaxID=1176649 RepID=UPI0008850AF4|nr:DUF2147 domain-containing protein [Agrobacterium fabrum]MDH6296156.1 uncharacterized protein (DUF2147 family) [Agrobacterium fabrum]SDB57058.1 Uncharacterized conserved protein, DUF2147 family [Agrobacterium fabrum]SER13911.1 Uncharacterized conserved protein, DUF2147 family [Agrobacterium fabrum]